MDGGPEHDLVRTRGDLWTVLGRTRHGDCEAVRLRGAGGANAGQVRTLLSPFDRLAPLALPAGWRIVRPRRWLHALRRAALEAHPFGGLRAADESAMDLVPYQLEPALAVFRRGATRLLIADEVGLGKTIQAGVVLRELSVRLDGLRAIVVMPASLREQWRQELLDRFRLVAVVADAAWLRSAARDLPDGINPWSLSGIYLASYDFVKQAEVLRPLEDVTWDVAVFDEAHAASPATDRRAAADALASRARRVVLLTATPHAGDPAQFDALCRLGACGESGMPAIFQRSRRDIGEAVRRTRFLTVRPSAAERRMHRLLERYASLVSLEAAPADSRAALAALVLRKRALSSAGSLLASVERRRDLLSGACAPQALQLALPLGDEDSLPDDVADETLAAPGLSDAGREQRFLGAISRAAAAAARRETKVGRLLRLLRRTREPAIVFTEYRDTLARLLAALEADGFRPLTLHGGMSPDERAATQGAFNRSGSVLLATDAASEGLNLHLRCRVVIHYELPWSPVRLQQRAGRVDRMGQTRPVHEVLLVAADTAERLVLAPLARRIAAARRSTSAGSRLFESLTESRVAAAVLRGDPIEPDVDAAPVQPGNTDLRTEAFEEVQRLSLRREWRARSAGIEHACAAQRRLLARVGRSRSSTLRPGSIVVFTIVLRNRPGEIVHAELIPVALCDDADERTARRHVEHAAAGGLARAADAHRLVTAALRAREQAIAAVGASAARALVQAGLFDRRALLAAQAERRTSAALAAEAQDRIAALRAADALTVSLDLTAKLVIALHHPR